MPTISDEGNYRIVEIDSERIVIECNKYNELLRLFESENFDKHLI
jgi:hypothetical protein